MVVALAGGVWIFMGAVMIFFVAVIYGFWTVKGSGIELHPFKNPYIGQSGGGPNRVGGSGDDRKRVSYSRGTSAGRGMRPGGTGQRGKRGSRR